jgi:hypothetical protein
MRHEINLDDFNSGVIQEKEPLSLSQEKVEFDTFVDAIYDQENLFENLHEFLGKHLDLNPHDRNLDYLENLVPAEKEKEFNKIRTECEKEKNMKLVEEMQKFLPLFIDSSKKIEETIKSLLDTLKKTE